MFAGSSAVFSYSGISLKLSKKVLDFVKDKIDTQDEKSKLYYEMVKILHDYLAGEFSSIKKYDNMLIDVSPLSSYYLSKIIKDRSGICNKKRSIC